jgi:hypothetical protein
MAVDTNGWTRDDLLREARLQTDAIQRLNVWLRLGYSMAAMGFLLGYWGLYGTGGVAVGVVGVILLVIGTLVSVVLKVGTTHAKGNVERMVKAAGVDIESDVSSDEGRHSPPEGRDGSEDR